MKHDNLIKTLSRKGENISDSTEFKGVNYLVEDGQITIITRNDGALTIAFDRLDKLIKELRNYKEVYG